MKKLLFLSSVVVFQLVSCMTETPVQVFERPVKVYKTDFMNSFTTSYTGMLKSDEISNLAFKMGGQLVKLAVVEGQKVSKGTFIAEIDPSDQFLQEQSAKANYVNSKSQLERFEKLVSKGAISQQQYESAQANYVRDKSAYENAKNMLSETKIYAPFSGIIEKRFVENYQRVQATEPVVRLINPANLEITFTLPENNIFYMSAPDKEFYVEFEAYPGKKFNARVTKFVDSSVDGSGVPVTVVIDDSSFNPEKYIVRPGFSCTVFLKLGNTTDTGTTSVPISAIYSSLATGKDSVWVYNPANSTVNIKGITIGGMYGKDLVIVKDGIQPGEEVVTAGIYQLVDGQKVKLLK